MNPMDSFDKRHKILSIHKNAMMGDMHTIIDRIHESGLKSGISEQEFWTVFSYVLHMHAVYATCKMVTDPSDMPRAAKNSSELHDAYLIVFGDAMTRGLVLEEILAAASKI